MTKEEKRLYNKEYRKNNKDRIKELKIWYNEENKEKIQIQRQKYHIKNRDKRLLYNKLYCKSHRVSIRKRMAKYRKDPYIRLVSNLRRRQRKEIIDKGLSKIQRTLKLTGCTLGVLIKHLESKFQPGMTWKNYGKWHMDHIIPCAAFNLSDNKQQKKCFNYKNLQPLWANDNLSKGDKIIKENKNE